MEALYVILLPDGGLVTMTTNELSLGLWRQTNARNAESGLSPYQILELKAKDITLDKPAQLPVIPHE